jgi:hypothetical protein
MSEQIHSSAIRPPETPHGHSGPDQGPLASVSVQVDV